MFKSLLNVLKTLSSVNSIFLEFSKQANFLKSANMWRLRIFELQKSIIYHEKALEKLYPKMIFSKTSTETLPSKNPKNPEMNPKTWYVNGKVFIIADILYIVENVLKKLFNDNIFKNFNWNHTIEQTQKLRNCNLKLLMSMKIFKW